MTHWAYLYLLRVPLLAWLVLVGLAPLSVWGAAPLGPVLRGLFDLAPAAGGGGSAGLVPLRIVVAFALVTLQALMAATAIGVSARLVVLEGAVRFGAGQVTNTPGVRLSLRVVPALAALVLVAGAWSQSWGEGGVGRVGGMTVGTVGGVALFYVLATDVQRWLWRRVRGRRRADRQHLGRRAVERLVGGLERLATVSPAGYLRDGQLHDRHVHALLQASVAALVYVGLLLVKLTPTEVAWVPTLCLVLTLLILVCYVLGAVTFFFDRFRVPVLLVVLAYFTVVGLSARADSFFRTAEAPAPAWQEPNTPLFQLTRARTGRPVVLVAATGGGIQASAWTARVLAGLHQDTQATPARFDEAVRVISSVSGGSVGALFMLDAWGLPGAARLPPVDDLDTYGPVANAEASSLDDVAWGLVYSDVVYSLLPMVRAGDWMLTSDRGSSIESAWRARLSRRRLPLAEWRTEAVAGHRPAVIFNATLVESGERLLIATTDLERAVAGRPWCDPTAPPPTNVGRRDFRLLYCDREIEAVTAARLSATFPYVTPATRILRRAGPRRPEYHVVDGGYYDNYGVATLIEWLNDAIRDEAAGALPSILIVEIRAKPVGEQTGPDGSRGLLFQALHPVTTMLQVWGTGQLSHNELDARLLQASARLAAQNVRLRRVIFEFPSVDVTGVPIRPPLSWHLTPDDLVSLRWAWEWRMGPCRQLVRDFLREGPRAAGPELLRCGV